MPGNSFGKIFKITTFGESHGLALGVVIDGVPPNLPFCENDIQFELDRRRPGQSKITTQRQERDQPEILSGVFEGKTTGTSLCILIRNEDHRSSDYANIKNKFRPGHADYTYFKKYGIRDYRGGGRSSGRETVARVAAGALAKKILQNYNVSVIAYTLAVADIYAKRIDCSMIEKNIVRSPDLEASKLMIERIEQAGKKGDSLGGIIEAIVHRCPAGLGEPVFDKLDALLAHAILSIGGTKAIEFGDGFQTSKMTGSKYNDKFYVDGNKVRTMSNHSGGILGGMSTSADIKLRVAVKPTSSISEMQQTVTESMENTTIETHGRHDPCICPRIVPVIESMIAITLVDCLLMQKIIEPTIKSDSK